ncbi:hypothetical protein, partial [Chroococcus sp. FPU101]|uniref:hypothetical protein n=1 Tax=Chroococcus sp. FPU101 TaxID=1974212 RepID=UPI001A900851
MSYLILLLYLVALLWQPQTINAQSLEERGSIFKKIEVQATTVLSREEIEAIASPYLNKAVTL